MQSSRSPLLIVTGIALIVLPLVALGLKFFSFGWMMAILLFGPVLVLVVGYALQIVIAVQGFLLPRGLFQTAPGRARAIAAAWASSIAVVLLGVFMPDGGDVGYGSTLQVWLGAYSGSEGVEAMHRASDGLTETIAWIVGIVWLAGFLWLLVEWVIALVQRRRARRA